MGDVLFRAPVPSESGTPYLIIATHLLDVDLCYVHTFKNDYIRRAGDEFTPLAEAPLRPPLLCSLLVV